MWGGEGFTVWGGRGRGGQKLFCFVFRGVPRQLQGQFSAEYLEPNYSRMKFQHSGRGRVGGAWWRSSCL